MDCGVIAMVKKKYRYRLLSRMFEKFETRHQLREAARAANMGRGTMGLGEGHVPHLWDVMDILHDVWKDISATKVANCWSKSTLVNFTEEAAEATDVDNEETKTTDADMGATDAEMETTDVERLSPIQKMKRSVQPSLHSLQRTTANPKGVGPRE
jgi:hypothetical protein